jgi:RHS repeat-associated protein
VYNAAGQRVRKIAGGTTTEYNYGLAAKVVAEKVGTTWTVGYVYLGGQLVAQYSNSTTYFVHKDHLGSTRVLTRVDKSVHEVYDFLPYGESSSCTGAGATTNCFTGIERDGESGLDHTMFRKHSALLGRWLSPDPLYGSDLDPQTLNRYAYARNKPTSVIDPDGLYPRDQHEFITFMMAAILGRPDASEIAMGAGEMDNFWNAATGLFGIGYIINFNKHFGVPCNVSGTCAAGGRRLGRQLHLVEDNSPGGPHYLSGGYSFWQRLTSSFKHIVRDLSGNSPDRDPQLGGGFEAAWEVLRGNNPTPYPKELIEGTRAFLNANGLTITGVSVTQGGQTTTHGTMTNSGRLLQIITYGKYRIEIWEVPGRPDYRIGRSSAFLYRDEVCGVKACENP